MNNFDCYLINYLSFYLDVNDLPNYCLITKNIYDIMRPLCYQILKIKSEIKKRDKNWSPNKNIITLAAEYNYVNVLNWLKDSCNDFIYTDRAIEKAAKNGNINILNWFK